MEKRTLSGQILMPKERAPSDVMIFVTHLCNNNCVFCLDDQKKAMAHKDITLFKEEVDRAVLARPDKITLSGGEPTLHPKITDMINYVKSKGLKVRMVSNGRMFASKEFTKKVLEAGLDEVAISIHGADAASHDQLTRSKNSFKESLKGIMTLSRLGKKPSLEVCLSKENVAKINDLVSIAVDKLGIKEMNLIIPTLNNHSNINHADFDLAELGKFLPEIIDYCTSKDVAVWLNAVALDPEESHADQVNGRFGSRLNTLGYVDALKYLSEKLPPEENKEASILDIGCHVGQFLLSLRNKGYSKLVGIDNQISFVKVGKAAGADVRYIDAREIKDAFLKESFDAVFCVHVLNYDDKSKEDVLALRDGVFEGAHHALKKGGFLFCATLMELPLEKIERLGLHLVNSFPSNGTRNFVFEK